MDDKKNDIAEDEKFGNYLDHIYSGLGLKIKRISYDKNPEMQLKGVDIIETSMCNEVYIDEKARQRSANSQTRDNSFVFEINAYPVQAGNKVSNSTPYDGWFVDNNQLSTEYHLIVNIKKDDREYTCCNIYKVNKLDIKNALTNLGLDDKTLIDYAIKLRNDIEINGKGANYKRNKGDTGHNCFLIELRKEGNRCDKCNNLLISKKGRYGQYLQCKETCTEKHKFWPNHGLMFYTDQKYDMSAVPELPINLMLTSTFLINSCGAKRIY